MKVKSNFFAFFLIAVLLAGCSTEKIVENKRIIKSPETIEKTKTVVFDKYDSLKQKIREKFDDSLFANAHWGALIQSLKTGKIIFEQDPGKLFIPASNEKILTAAAALLSLGENYTFETYLNYNGEIRDSVLYGDLIVKSNGDPTLNTKFYGDAKSVFYSWADSLKAKGIKKIIGDIIGDDNSFENYPYGYGWTYDDLEASYSAEVNPLQLNENNLEIKIIPPLSLNEKVVIELNLPSEFYKISNGIIIGDTGKSNVSMTRKFGTNEISISGYLKTGSGILTHNLSISNPTLFYTTVLKEALEESGIVITGNSKDCDDIKDWKTTLHNQIQIAKHNSPSLKKIINVMMKESQNLYAETFVKVIGLKKHGFGSSRNGRLSVEDALKSFNVKPGTYRYMDGSGLSRYNLVSPEIIVKVLTGMRKSIYWQDWYNSFPVAGVDGTLMHRMKGTKAEANVRAKTGTMSNIRSLSGYVTSRDGEEMAFSFLLNDHLCTSSKTENVTDKVLEMISDFVGNNE